MRLLADENIGLEVVMSLRKDGHDVKSAIEKLAGATDRKILTTSRKENRIIITSDTDFGELVYNQQLPHVGIILLRLTDQRNRNKILVLKNVFKTHGIEMKYKFIVITEAKIRIRETFLKH